MASSRFDSIENRRSHNSAAVYSSVSPSGRPRRAQRPGFQFDGDRFEDEDEELVRDDVPQSLSSHRDLIEGDIVDDRALRYATLDPVPSNASGFRAWKNQILLIMAKLDISDRDYLACWLSKASEVDSAEVIGVILVVFLVWIAG